jgi:hypothetical protein
MGPGDGRPVRTRRIENIGHLDEQPLAAEASNHLVHPVLSTSDGVPLVRADGIGLRIDEVSEDVVFRTLMRAAHFDARDDPEGGFGRSGHSCGDSRHRVVVGDGQYIKPAVDCEADDLPWT